MKNIFLRGLAVLLLAGIGRADEMDISLGWRFAPDREAIGLSKGWPEPSFDDSSWKIIDAGRNWEEQGFSDYDGLGWYRKEILVPEEWEEVFIYFQGVDDDYQLFVNGEKVVDFGYGKSVWNIPTGTDITQFIQLGKENLISICVDDWYIYGGLVDKAKLTNSRSMLYPERKSLIDGWRFSIDPDDLGFDESWFSLQFDDSSWKEVKAGKSWEGFGYPEYDGTAWYRRWIEIPKDWKEGKVWISFAGVDDEYDLYLNGERIAHYGDREVSHGSVWNKPTVTEISGYIDFSKRNLLTLRVVDWGAGGGIGRLPVLITNSEFGTLSYIMFLKHLARMDREKIYPRWVTGKGVAWTATGVVGGMREALMGLDGAIQPNNSSFTINFWIFDGGKLYAPELAEDFRWDLFKGYLPSPQFSWRGEDISLQSRLFVSEETAFALLSLRNNSNDFKRIKLFCPIRPYSVNGGINPVTSLKFDEKISSVIVDRCLALLSDRPPDGFGATSGQEEDISAYCIKGILPERKEVEDPEGFCSGALMYELKIPPGRKEELAFRMPMAPLKPTQEVVKFLQSSSPERKFWEEMSKWERLIKKVKIELPDKRLTDAFYSSIAYALINMDEEMIHPGPLAYANFWARDSAYIIMGLDRAGLKEIAQKAVEFYVETQKPSGEFPSIVNVERKPVGPHEWDSQGQGITSLVHHYRITKDRDWLQKVYPSIRKACEFLLNLRQERLTKEFEGTSLYGILPPSVSAEDLGPGDWHHYWDDFWAVGGLREASYAAKVLGMDEDSKWMKEEADELLKSTLESAKRVMEERGIDWIPNGPEDWMGSSMARGTSPGLWPTRVLDPEDPIVRRSFQVYWDKWVGPSGGGYLHGGGNFWPYAGLELAHCYLFLGEKEKMLTILNWTIENQTAKGVYSWSEVANRRTFLFRSGDMPHCWTTGEYTNLLRDILLYEDGERIILCAGVPQDWLRLGEISIKDAPTYFGKLSFKLRKGQAGELLLTMEKGCEPPKGFLLIVPGERRIARVIIDRGAQAKFSGREVYLPAKVRKVKVEFQSSELLNK